MFGVESVGRGLSFAKVLTGLNRTLTIANQVIPLYQQAKPMIHNARNAFRILKEFSAPDKQEVKTNPSKNTEVIKSQPQKKMIETTTSNNQPVFFV